MPLMSTNDIASTHTRWWCGNCGSERSGEDRADKCHACGNLIQKCEPYPYVYDPGCVCAACRKVGEKK